MERATVPFTVYENTDLDVAKAEIERLKLRVVALRTTIVGLVAAHDYTNLDRGIGSKTSEGKRWLNARQQIFFSDVS